MSKAQDMINSKAVKEYILRTAKETRPGWDCTQVSTKALNLINAKVKMMIQGAVQRHPTKGKTFTEVS